jgi:hypothetical protein
MSQPRRSPFGTEVPSAARIHGIGVDVITAKRYSVPILGKILVIIANPVEHPTQTQLLASLPHPNLKVMDLIGGYFSA